MKYYVDNNVSNSSNGTAWSTAWKDFSNINWGIIRPGDTIYVSGGTTSQTYTQTLAVGASGSPANAVTITKGVDAGHNGTVVIDGRNTLASGITLNGRNYSTIDGFSIRNIADSGISVKNATAGVVIQNNSIYSGDPGGGNARGYDVRNSVGTDAVIVRNNNFSTPTSTRAQTDGIWSSGNDGVVFEHNRIVISNNDTTGHSDGFQSYQDRNVYVHDNWFEQANGAKTDNHGAWISNTQTGGVVRFYNNTVLVPNLTNDSAVTHYMEAGWSGGGTADFQSNTITGGRRAINIDRSPNVQINNNVLQPAVGGSGYVITNGNIPPGNVDGNVVWSPRGSIAYLGNSNLTWSQWQARGYDRSGVVADPALMNSAAQDHGPDASVPAVGQDSTAQAAKPDTLAVRVSEDAWQGDAQFTIMIDGVTIGGVHSATASHAAGQSQVVSISGSWGSGPHSIGITFINDAWGGTATTDRNLHVEQVTYNQQTVSSAPEILLRNDTANFDVPAVIAREAAALSLPSVEDAWHGDAQYSVSMDGKSLAGGGAGTASNTLGQPQAGNPQTVLTAANLDVVTVF